MKVIYRISNAGNKKNKPDYVNPTNIFRHFIRVFSGYDIYVIADNLNEENYEYICKYFPKERIFRTSLSNAGAFIHSVQFAIDRFQPSDLVYLAEDDYIYKKNAPRIIEEGLKIADYSSGYDHPDKYINNSEGGPNPFIAEGGELTRVLLTESSHWKFTNSCCMTFAASVKTLSEDLQIYKKYCSGRIPGDFPMFCELIGQKKRKLVSSIPAVSTHGETDWLAKLVDWDKEVLN